MTAYEIFVPLFALGLAGVGVLLARHSAHRLERDTADGSRSE